LHNDAYLKQKTGTDLQKILENPQNFNSYNYTNNNPIKRVDVDGEWFKEVMTGKQSFSDFNLELGQAGQDLYNSNSTARIIMNHPYATGAVMGVVGGITVVMASKLAGQGGLLLPGLMSKGDKINIGESFGKLGTVIENASGKINSFINRGSSHGLDQIITRGVKPADILETVKTPLLRLQQDGGNILYLSEKAVIVLNKFNNVVTAYSQSNFEQPIKSLLQRLIK
jgi:hypothetical protein